MSEYVVCRQFEGKLMTLESIHGFPDTTEKEHFLEVRKRLEREGFDPDDFRIGEIPTEYVYYFERAVEESGVDYFSIYLNEKGVLMPQFTTLQCDKNGQNTFDCTTIRESIARHEC